MDVRRIDANKRAGNYIALKLIRKKKSRNDNNIARGGTSRYFGICVIKQNQEACLYTKYTFGNSSIKLFNSLSAGSSSLLVPITNNIKPLSLYRRRE